MSINSLTDDSLRLRRNAYRTTQPPTLESATNDDVPPNSAVAADRAENNSISNALTILIQYIPTEVLTLYLATVSAYTALHEWWSAITTTGIYWFFAVLTPVLVLLIDLSKTAADNLPLPKPRAWPWWKMFAAMIAFLAWALAVPNNPYISGAAAAVAGLAALVVSTLLSLLTPLARRLLGATS